MIQIQANEPHAHYCSLTDVKLLLIKQDGNMDMMLSSLAMVGSQLGD